jgi:hypothetical protein
MRKMLGAASSPNRRIWGQTRHEGSGGNTLIAMGFDETIDDQLLEATDPDLAVQMRDTFMSSFLQISGMCLTQIIENPES